MARSLKLILQFIALMAFVALWFFMAFIVSQLIASTELVEMFLITLGGLLLARIGVILAREMSKLSDLRHWQRTQRCLREMKLRERKQEQMPLMPRYRRSSRSW